MRLSNAHPCMATISPRSTQFDNVAAVQSRADGVAGERQARLSGGQLAERGVMRLVAADAAASGSRFLAVVEVLGDDTCGEQRVVLPDACPAHTHTCGHDAAARRRYTERLLRSQREQPGRMCGELKAYSQGVGR